MKQSHTSILIAVLAIQCFHCSADGADPVGKAGTGGRIGRGHVRHLRHNRHERAAGDMSGATGGSGGGSAGGSSGGAGSESAGGSGMRADAGSGGGSADSGSTAATPSAGCGKGTGRPPNGTVTVSNAYYLAFPSTYDGTTPMPALLGFHGCGCGQPRYRPQLDRVDGADQGHRLRDRLRARGPVSRRFAGAAGPTAPTSRGSPRCTTTWWQTTASIRAASLRPATALARSSSSRSSQRRPTPITSISRPSRPLPPIHTTWRSPCPSCTSTAKWTTSGAPPPQPTPSQSSEPRTCAPTPRSPMRP